MEAAKKARDVAPLLATATTEQKNNALRALKASLIAREAEFTAANNLDREEAAKRVADGTLEAPLYKRLDCTGEKYKCLVEGIDEVIALDDPVGLCHFARELSADLNLYRLTCPIGVLLVIFESRPDACIQILTLALKSGNAVLLKGGKEAKHSLLAIESIINKDISGMPGIPHGSVQMIMSREDVATLLKADELVDLVVPRGSNQLVRYIKDNTTIPVLGHADGLCLTYVDKDADVEMAVKVVTDAKLNYPAACNAVETLLVHKDIAATFLPPLGAKLAPLKVEFHADPTTLPFLPKSATTPATAADYKTEFLSETMCVKAVGDVDEAIRHINQYGSGHTDAILTENSTTAEKFMNGVDSSGVYCNCSTRFADGYRYGFGAEVGISTNRIHARGPVGLEGLVTYRYRIYGKGQTVTEFSDDAPNKLTYTHKDIPLATVGNTTTIAAKQKPFFKKA